MSNHTLIEIRGLSKIYRRPGADVTVLNEMDLTIEQGGTVSIVGASGVGKSTLLHLLGGLDRPTGGQVLFKGVDIFSFDDDKLARFRNRKVGFVFQFHHLLPEFDALENVMMPCLIGGQSRQEAARRAKSLLDQVGLADRMNHRIGEMSGGEQQRTAVARALVMEPDLLLADEPTGNLDEKTGRRINELLLKLNSDLGLTTVVATHNMELAAELGVKLRLVGGRAMEEVPNRGES